MKNALTAINVLEDVTLGGGTIVSLTMIQTILGITLLVINIALICAKIGIKVYQRIKKGDLDGAVDEIEKGQKELDDLKNKGEK